MSEKIKNRRRALSHIFKGCFFLLILLIVVIAAISTNFEPLSDFVSELIATLTPIPTLTNTPTNTPTSTLTPTPTNTHTPTPTRLPKTDPQLAYAISVPGNVRLNYNANTGSGTVSWSAAEWLPQKPLSYSTRASTVAYELHVIYPNQKLGPFLIRGRLHHNFTNLNAHQYSQVKITIVATGSILIGQYRYDFQSAPAEIRWTPTPIPTITLTPTITPTPTSTSTYTPTKTPTLTYTPGVSEMRILFKVSPNNTINIRSCPDKTCDPPLGQARRGDILEVVAQKQESDGAWYEIKYGDRTAYIAGWLTTHIPTSTPTSTSTNTPTNTFTPTATPTPTYTFTASNMLTPTRLPASDSRLAFTLTSPLILQEAYLRNGRLTVSWIGSRWMPSKPRETGSIFYEVTILNAAGNVLEKKTTTRRSVVFSNAQKYANKQLRLRIEAVATLRIDRHKYEFRSKTTGVVAEFWEVMDNQ